MSKDVANCIVNLLKEDDIANRKKRLRARVDGGVGEGVSNKELADRLYYNLLDTPLYTRAIHYVDFRYCGIWCEHDNDAHKSKYVTVPYWYAVGGKHRYSTFNLHVDKKHQFILDMMVELDYVFLFTNDLIFYPKWKLTVMAE